MAITLPFLLILIDCYTHNFSKNKLKIYFIYIFIALFFVFYAVFINNGVATLEDGVLAGGSKPLLSCVKKAIEFGIDFYEAVKMASETPANSLGLKKGRIETGFDADLVILNDDLSVYKTIIGGKII